MGCPICGNNYDSWGTEVDDNFCFDCRKEARKAIEHAIDWVYEERVDDSNMTLKMIKDMRNDIASLLNEELFDNDWRKI